MSDAHHGINSSTQKYQSTQSNVALTSCCQDSGSPPFLKQALLSRDGMYSGREFQMRAADGTKDLLWLTRLERGIWTAKSCDLTERLRRGSNWRCSGSSWQSSFRGLSIIHTVEQCEGSNFSSGSQWLNLVRDEVILRKVNDPDITPLDSIQLWEWGRSSTKPCRAGIFHLWSDDGLVDHCSLSGKQIWGNSTKKS